MERSSGIRKMQTFRKLPITNPNKKMNVMTKVCALRASVCNVPHPLSTLNAPAHRQCPMPNTLHSLCGLCALGSVISVLSLVFSVGVLFHANLSSSGFLFPRPKCKMLV
jgi:hypothetical protein